MSKEVTVDPLDDICTCRRIRGDHDPDTDHAFVFLCSAGSEAAKKLVPRAVDLIIAERSRQIVTEGWSPEHDDTHIYGELPDAAECYEQFAKSQYLNRDPPQMFHGVPRNWPWTPEWWKPSDDPIRNLVKAAALRAAELDRLLRRQANPPAVNT